MRFRSILISALLFLVRPIKSLSATNKEGWQIGKIPIEDGMRIVNPDGILSLEQVEELQKQMSVFERTHLVKVGGADDVQVQIAAAIVERMNLDAFREHDEDMEDIAAEAFAMNLHNTLGVGHDTPEGGTGVFLFLSTYDRVIYISRGGAVKSHLGNFRVDRILSEVRPYLKGAKYGDALSAAIDQVGEFIERGEPSWRETAYENFLSMFPILAIFSTIFSIKFFKERHDRHQQRQYAQVESQLSELDRTRAEALQGQYQATSCPICLEDFVSDTIGSDEQPIKLLRCGHVFDESCWAEWVNSGRGNVSRCPICKTDVGGVANGTSARTHPERNEELHQRNPNHERNENENQAMNLVDDNHHHDRAHEPDRALRQYVRERNFRLARLATRFPQYVGRQQIQRWSSPNYDGSLAQDSQFRQSNPRELQQTRSNFHSDNNRSFSGFGGGGSSGGRGGRW